MSLAIRSPATSAALALAIVAALSSPIRGQREGDDAFKDGIEARKKTQWSDVVTLMRRAIQEDSKESTRKVGRTLGLGGTDYLPYFFLGEALFKLGDCPGAMDNWSTSQRQGVVRTRSEYYPVLLKEYAACEAKGVLPPAKFPPQLELARQQERDGRALAEKVLGLAKSDQDVWNSNASMREQYDRARTAMLAAQSHLRTAERTRLQRDFDEVAREVAKATEILNSIDGEFSKTVERGGAVTAAASEVRRIIGDAKKLDEQIEPSTGVLAPSQAAARADGQNKLESAREQLVARPRTEASVAAAHAAATEGLDILKQLLGTIQITADNELKKQLQRRETHATQIFAKVDNQFSTIQSQLELKRANVSPDIPSRRDAALKRFEALRKRLDGALKKQQLGPIAVVIREAERLLTELTDIVSVFGPLTLEDRGVPTWLQTGAALYFRGDYARALEALDGGPAQGPSQLHAHLLRAAAQHALYVRSGEKDASRRDQAVAEIKRCKQINLAFVPDAAAFSPRFLEFYRRDGGPAPQTSRAQ